MSGTSYVFSNGNLTSSLVFSQVGHFPTHRSFSVARTVCRIWPWPLAQSHQPVSRLYLHSLLQLKQMTLAMISSYAFFESFQHVDGLLDRSVPEQRMESNVVLVRQVDDVVGSARSSPGFRQVMVSGKSFPSSHSETPSGLHSRMMPKRWLPSTTL